MLSMKRYRWLCVLGGEVAYLLCLLGGMLPLRSNAGTEVHHSLFETLPGFVWITPASVALGAAYVFAFAWIFGSYMVWMHNSSLIEPKLHLRPIKHAKARRDVRASRSRPSDFGVNLVGAGLDHG
jgi:hypothetical protein